MMPPTYGSEFSRSPFFDKKISIGSIERFLTKRQLAEQLQLSQAYINILMKRDGLPHWKLGRAVRYRLDEVALWLSGRRRP